MQKTLLILRACGVDGETQECDNIKSQAELYGLEVHDHCLKNNKELEDVLNRGFSFNYIYLSSHGNAEGFGNEDGNIDFTWDDFGGLLCNANCMEENCIVMLSCCRGGLNQVAYALFFMCLKITYIVGPRQSLSPHDMLISFNILLYNLEQRNIDPIVACEKIKSATDIRFICFDRLETETDMGYLLFTKQFEFD